MIKPRKKRYLGFSLNTEASKDSDGSHSEDKGTDTTESKLTKWLLEEFQRLHSLIEYKPIPATVAYREISRHLAQSMARDKLGSGNMASGGVEVKIIIMDKEGNDSEKAE